MVDQINADAVQVEPILVPRFAVSTFNTTMTPTELVIVASSLMPANAKGEIVFGQKPELVLGLSPQSGKELMVLLAGVVAEYEKEYGEIRTPFLDERKKT